MKINTSMLLTGILAGLALYFITRELDRNLDKLPEFV